MGICETYLGILYRCEKPGTYNSMVLYAIAYFELYLYFLYIFLERQKISLLDLNSELETSVAKRYKNQCVFVLFVL